MPVSIIELDGHAADSHIGVVQQDNDIVREAFFGTLSNGHGIPAQRDLKGLTIPLSNGEWAWQCICRAYRQHFERSGNND